MPNAETSPTLHNLVNQFQVHKCNKYCTKSYKRQAVFYKKCTFGFPRPAKKEIEINDVVDCVVLSKNKQPRKRLYHLPRNESEKFINDYNAALLLANQANVDVQYIGSQLPYYTSDYIAKHERSEQDAMWRDSWQNWDNACLPQWRKSQLVIFRIIVESTKADESVIQWQHQ